MRTTREKTPVLYGPDAQFHIGGCQVTRQSDKDQVTVIGAGITLHEALKAYDTLQQEGIAIRVIDLYSVKPVDTATLREAMQATGNRLVVVEDHWPEGGLGDAVLAAFAAEPGAEPAALRMVHLAVKGMPGSGKPQELMDAAGISASHIVEAVRSLLQ
jgi:transketolase